LKSFFLIELNLLNPDIQFKNSGAQHLETNMDYVNDELENMASNAAYEEPADEISASDSSQKTIKMWQERFGYSYDEAATLIGITKTVKKPSGDNQVTL
jgi:hypothetical protein